METLMVLASAVRRTGRGWGRVIEEALEASATFVSARKLTLAMEEWDGELRAAERDGIPFYLPRTTVSDETLLTIRNVAEGAGVSFGTAMDALLREDPRFEAAAKRAKRFAVDY